MNIPRDEALEALRHLAESGILCDELELAVEEIAHCIEAEKLGLHLWGADDDADELFTAFYGNLTTGQTERLRRIRVKYRFSPSAFETEEVER